MKLDTIVVPLDGSVLAEMALARAAEIVGGADTCVILVRAAQAYTFPGVDMVDAQVKVVREAEAYLADAAARMRALDVKDVRGSVWYGAAAPAIIEAAKAHHADLIVMTTHGRSGLGRLVLGSVAGSVVCGTTTPILLLRDGTAAVATPDGSAEEAPSDHGRN